jgi:hypothetical protein
MKQVFVHLWHLQFWRRFLKILLFSLPVRKIFGILEPCEQILKRTPQGIFLQKISFLGVIVSEKKIFKEKLTLDAYEMP